jgi:hypothetical protein
MDKKQTAVEWLIDMHFGGIEHVTPYFKKHIEEAKEMEREQIINAFEQGENNSVDYFNPENRIKESEHYYNETYGGNK